MGKLLAFIGAYMRANLGAALEYRASLLSQILGMLINDVLWVVFWGLYFTKFPVLKGWTLEDVMVLWASFAVSAGLVWGFLANSLRIPQMVVEGELDYYLALPKDVLLHLLISRIRFVNFGDLLFGPILLAIMVELTWAKVAVFVAASLLAAVVMVSFHVIVGSLVFYLGNSGTLSDQLISMLMHFSTYPAPIFETGVKFILFTLIPAGFITTLPVELVREFNWAGFLQLLGGAAVFLGVAVLLFRQGLKRYESGNLMAMRS